MRHGALLGSFLVALLTSSSASVAFAQGTPPAGGNDARTRFRQGQAAYQQGDYESAIREWKAAYAIDPRPLILYNVSQAHERLGQFEAAASELERYLAAADPNDSLIEDAKARLAQLKARLARTAIRIEGGPANATVSIDDTEIGKLPLADVHRVDPGSHRILVRAPAFRDFRATVVVPGGEVVTVEVTMEKAEAVRTAAAGPEDESSPWPFVLMGAGGGFVALGTVAGVLALGRANAADSSDSKEADRARLWAGLADGLLFTGGAAVAAGLLWWILDMSSDDEDEKGSKVEIRPAASPSAAGLEATWRL